MVCFEVGMSFTGIFSKSMIGIKDLLVVEDDMVGNCVVIACSNCIFPARRVSGSKWQDL